MRYLIAMAMLIAGTSMSWGDGVISISAKKKTMSTQDAVQRKLLKAAPSSSENSMFVQFELDPGSADVADTLTATWMILTTDSRGRTRHGTSGTKHITFTAGQALPLRTDTFALRRSSVRRDGQQHFAEDQFYGYGIKVTDKSGKLVAEAYYPADAKTTVEQLEQRRAQRRDRMKNMLPQDRANMIRDKGSKASRIQPEDVDPSDLQPKPLVPSP